MKIKTLKKSLRIINHHLVILTNSCNYKYILKHIIRRLSNGFEPALKV